MKLKGIVIHGDKRGREIGFPTANLELKDLESKNLIKKLDFGVYASQVFLEGESYKSVTHFGPSKTFDIDKPSLEVHIFNFNKEIYGEIIELKIYDKIRGTLKFNSVEELILGIKNDIQKADLILDKF